MIAERVPRIPRLRQRAVRIPLDLQRPVWVDDPSFDLDAHVRRAALPSPGGQAELDAFLGEVMARPLPPDRPLWEMVVVEGLDGGNDAVVARLHHAIVDGVSGATAMAAFLDVGPGPPRQPEPAADAAATRPRAGLPSAASLLRYAAMAAARQPERAMSALNRGLDAMVALAEQNRRLAAAGRTPPPAPFRAPRTSLNGNVTAERVVATLDVPLARLEQVRSSCGDATVNDVILCAVGRAADRLLASRGERVPAPLVALVPVSTRGPATVPEGGSPARVGNAVSGMLVSLPQESEDPFDALRAVAQATAVAKEQEERAGGELLEGLTGALPPFAVRMAMQGIGRFQLFDRFPPPFNLVVSTVVLPEVELWWAGRPVSSVYPFGPVVDGVGLNVTAMTYRGNVSIGLLACPRQVPQIQDLARGVQSSFDVLVSRAAGSAPVPEGSTPAPVPG